MKAVKKKKHRQNNQKTVAIIGILTAVAWLSVAISYRNSALTGDTEKDLLTIENSIDSFIDRNNRLPADLDELALHDTHDLLQEYEYTYEALTNDGGPTLAYQICTNFAEEGMPLSQEELAPGSDSHDFNTSDGYVYHRAGRQCYAINHYKGAPHVSYLLNDDEVVPLETFETDFQGLEEDLWGLYVAHAAVLGITPDTSDLVRRCSGLSEVYGSLKDEVYVCSVNVKKSNKVIGIPDGKEAMAQLSDVVLAQGFSEFDSNESGPSSGQDASLYYQSFSTYKDNCSVEANLAPKAWGLDYRLSCAAKNSSSLPAGYILCEQASSSQECAPDYL